MRSVCARGHGRLEKRPLAVPLDFLPKSFEQLSDPPYNPTDALHQQDHAKASIARRQRYCRVGESYGITRWYLLRAAVAQG